MIAESVHGGCSVADTEIPSSEDDRLETQKKTKRTKKERKKNRTCGRSSGWWRRVGSSGAPSTGPDWAASATASASRRAPSPAGVPVRPPNHVRHDSIRETNMAVCNNSIPTTSEPSKNPKLFCRIGLWNWSMEVWSTEDRLFLFLFFCEPIFWKSTWMVFFFKLTLLSNESRSGLPKTTWGLRLNET